MVQSARIAALHAERSASGSALYEPAMEGLDEHLKSFDRELRMAFAGDCRLQLYLQPQIEARSGRCLGAEALLRWCRANGRWVAPPVCWRRSNDLACVTVSIAGFFLLPRNLAISWL